MTHRTLVATVAALVLGTELDAQTCLGRASFFSGAMRAGASYRDAGNTDIVAGEFAYGTVRSGFAGAELGATRARNLPPGTSSSSTRMGGTVGAQVTVSEASRVQFCPTLGLGMSFGSSDFQTSQNEFRTRYIELGTALGMSTGPVEELHFIPSAGVKYVLEGTSGTRTFSGTSSDYHTLAAGTGYVVLSLGIGRGTFTVTPLVYLPIGDTRRTNQWGVGGTYNFGRRP